MTVLLDGSVAIAMLDGDHEHYEPARKWVAALAGSFATSPITQGAVIRYAMRRGRSAHSATAALQSVTNSGRHEFWADDVEYDQVRLDGVVGHRQVTDAYLAQLARQHEARIATFDKGFAALHDDVVELVPTS